MVRINDFYRTSKRTCILVICCSNFRRSVKTTKINTFVTAATIGLSIGTHCSIYPKHEIVSLRHRQVDLNPKIARNARKMVVHIQISRPIPVGTRRIWSKIIMCPPRFEHQRRKIYRQRGNRNDQCVTC